MKGYALILGAGASHGAVVSTPRRPPLDGDFLATAKAVLSGHGRHGADPDAWRRLVARLGKARLKIDKIVLWRLEQLSTYLEARANMPALQATAGKPANYSTALTALTEVICRTLAKTGGTESCPIHEAVIRAVDPCCIVTFNYDLIVDVTLHGMKRLAWSNKDYAGSSIRIGAAESNYQRPRPTTKHAGAIPLYKLHGSINWHAHSKGGGFSLAVPELPWKTLTYAEPPRMPLVVPPVAAKMTIRDGPLRSSWSSAAGALRRARGWIIWGYSFPSTDTVTHVLWRTALAKNTRPKPVIVINPDPSVAPRIEEALQKVSVASWGSVERFLFDAGRVALT
jgi:hypothetical protein